MLDTLPAQGAPSGVRDKTGRGALSWTILENLVGMAVALVECGTVFDPGSEDKTPLQLARMMRHSDWVAVLVRRWAGDRPAARPA